MKHFLLRLNPVILNGIFFLWVSLFFTFVISSLGSGSSAQNSERFVPYLTERAHLLIGPVICTLCYFPLRFFQSISVIFNLTFLLFLGHMALDTFQSILAQGAGNSFVGPNKIMLILTVLYFPLGLSFAYLLSQELKCSLYQHLCSGRELGRGENFVFQASLLVEGAKIEGHLSNWGQRDCFIVFPHGEKESIQKLRKMLRPVEVSLSLGNKVFVAKAKIMTCASYGVGIKFLTSRKEANLRYNWNNFYKIITDRGHVPNV